MKLREMRSQIEALYLYIQGLIKVLKGLDGKNKIDADGNSLPSERDEYYAYSSEREKILKRYERFSLELQQEYPQVFIDLMEFTSLHGLRELEELLRELYSILKILDNYIAQASSNNQNYSYNAMPNKDESVVTLFIYCYSEVITVSSKLNSLHTIYNELCMLFNVSIAQYPLRIGHLEVGSIWTTIFGESKVIAVITKFFEETAAYFYRTTTYEGQRRELPTKIEEIKQLLTLSAELKKRDINTDEIDESIQKAGHIIAKSYLNILENTSAIKVNNNLYNANDDNHKDLLQNTKEPKLLENPDQTNL